MQQIKIPEHIQFILDRLKSAGFDSYLVGGCVRDQLMGKTPHDYDITTPALPDDVSKCFQDCRIIKTGLKHGTVTVLSDGKQVEITTFRTDGEYNDNRHPESVTFVSKLEDDLSRRDFTVNALAYSPDCGLVDLFGGVEDIKAGLIRCVGEPDKRFNEDGLRIMRALRFASKLDFSIEDKTGDAVHRRKGLLDNIAAERLFVELKGILTGVGVENVLMKYSDVLFWIMPELSSMYNFPQNNPHHIYDVWEHTVKALAISDKDEVLRLVLLFHDSGKPACHTTDTKGIDHFHGHPDVSTRIASTVLNRLRCDNATKADVLFLVKMHDVHFSKNDKRVMKSIADIGEERFSKLLKVKYADTMAHAYRSRDNLLNEIHKLQNILTSMKEDGICMSQSDMAINGDDLINMGVPQGKAVGQILSTLFETVCTGETPNNRELLLEKARRILDGN